MPETKTFNELYMLIKCGDNYNEQNKIYLYLVKIIFRMLSLFSKKTNFYE